MTTISFKVSQKWIDQQFIETGRKMQSDQTVTLNDEELTAEQRALIVKAQALKLPYPHNNLPPYKVVLLTFTYKPPFVNFGLYAPKPGGTNAESKINALVLDKIPSISEVFEYMAAMIGQYHAVTAMIAESPAEYARLMAEYELKQQAEKVEREAKWKAAQERLDAQQALRDKEKAEAAARFEEKRQSQMAIPWKENGTAIVNLHNAIRYCARATDGDSRFRNWIKEVTSINRASNNGYCFEGEWIADQTVEIQRGAKRVYLVATTTGSRNHNRTRYNVVVLNADGLLAETDIETDDKDAGWALRIRDQVEALHK